MSVICTSPMNRLLLLSCMQTACRARIIYGLGSLYIESESPGPGVMLSAAPRMGRCADGCPGAPGCLCQPWCQSKGPVGATFPIYLQYCVACVGPEHLSLLFLSLSVPLCISCKTGCRGKGGEG